MTCGLKEENWATEDLQEEHPGRGCTQAMGGGGAGPKTKIALGVPGAEKPAWLKRSQQGRDQREEEVEFIPIAVGSPWRALGRETTISH